MLVSIDWFNENIFSCLTSEKWACGGGKTISTINGQFWVLCQKMIFQNVTTAPLKSLFLEFRCTSLVWIEFLQKSVRVVILKSKRSEDLNQGILDLTRRKFGCLLSNSRRFSKTQIHAYKFFQKKTLKSYFLRQGQVDKGL